MEEKAEADVMNDEWRTRGGSIWNQNRQPATTRVKCRATTCQLVQLVKFMEKHKELAVSHAQPFAGSDRLWEQLADHINQFGPPKNPKQCKTTWRDLRKRAFAMMRSRNKDKQKSAGRNLYGMAPKIISLIAAASGLPKAGVSGLMPAAEAGSSKATPLEVPVVDKSKEQGVVKVERTSAGDQLVIRVTDKQNNKSNVFNSFSVSDGHFENNIVVKEEREDPQPEEEEPGTMETEEERTDSVSEAMFPAAEALLGNQDSSREDVCKALKDLNQTLQRFVSEYAERTVLQRERLELERAKFQFDMEMFHRKKTQEDDSKSDS